MAPKKVRRIGAVYCSKRRGLNVQPELVIANGALGFWDAVGEVWPTTRSVGVPKPDVVRNHRSACRSSLKPSKWIADLVSGILAYQLNEPSPQFKTEGAAICRAE
jgi:hypothetical protein